MKRHVLSWDVMTARRPAERMRLPRRFPKSRRSGLERRLPGTAYHAISDVKAEAKGGGTGSKAVSERIGPERKGYKYFRPGLRAGGRPCRPNPL